MLLLNETQFAKLSEGNPLALENTYIYLLSRALQLGDEDSTGNSVAALMPSEDLLSSFANKNINKKKFKKEYFKEIKTYENMFMIYTIVRSIKEKSYLPVFVCSDDEFDTGYMKVFAEFLNKEFGLQAIKLKKYVKSIKEMWKDTKSLKKKKKRRKAFLQDLKSTAKKVVSISKEGLSTLDKLDKQYAIDRIAILINQSDDVMTDVPKKSIVKSITTYAELNKKAAKKVKEGIKELDLSKKSERWSKKDAVSLALNIYNQIHNIEVDED